MCVVCAVCNGLVYMYSKWFVLFDAIEANPLHRIIIMCIVRIIEQIVTAIVYAVCCVSVYCKINDSDAFIYH